MRVTLSERTILVNLLTPLRRKQVEPFSCHTKIPMLLDLSMSGEKFRNHISSPIAISKNLQVGASD